ncbi:hypothetical protein Slala03_24270 [Streptomyces lavendulae subsp. lavendulae]|nr:hypothetical protein Slala03_24270 [Streptomyces lavendulae subsp. lavendulae]
MTAKAPAARIPGQVVEVRAGQKQTSGGSRETDENDCTAIPTGRPSLPHAVMTAMPVQKPDRTDFMSAAAGVWVDTGNLRGSYSY